MMAAWDQDEFVLDPSRITLFIGPTGYDGDTFKRQQLMDRYGIQINKTSRNSVLFMTNIGTTRSSVAFLVEVLVNIARELDQRISEMSLGEREHFERAVYRLTEMSLPLPDFSGFHPAFLDHSGREATPEGDVRRAFYLSYDDTNCEYLTGEQIDERLDAGVDIVSATYVTPYPPGFPVLVPGQVFSREILQFMRDLDTPEIHGYLPAFGYRVYTEKAIEMVSASVGVTAGNGHRSVARTASPEPQKAPKKKSAKRGGPNGDRNLPEIGQDELLGQQQPGDAVQADAGS
jgi:arginine decarboxylase